MTPCTSTPPKTRPRKVSGVTFTLTQDFAGNRVWEGILGDYRITVEPLSGHRNICMVYHLDPKFKAYDPTRPRINQECLLNGVHPQGPTLATCMAQAVQSVRSHYHYHGHEFRDAKVIMGQDLKAGMYLHHKGTFHHINRVQLKDTADPSQGYTALFERGGLWITLEHPITVWEPSYTTTPIEEPLA